MKFNKLLLIGAMLTLLAGLTACQEKGPAEKLGEKIDEAAESTGEKIEDATDKAADKLEDAGDKVEDSTH